MKYSIPTLLALSQETGVVCNWTQDARECRLIRPSQGATTALKENPQNRLEEDPTKSTPVKGSLKIKARRGRRAKRHANTAPATTFAPSEAGFAQFLREHSSPGHQRVTAGGRIVPMPFIEDSESANMPTDQPATILGAENEPQDGTNRLNEPIEQDEQPGTRPWHPANTSNPATTEAPRNGLLPGFDPADYANVDPFVRSLQQPVLLAEIATDRIHQVLGVHPERTGRSNLVKASRALQHVMGARPATRTMPMNQQHGTRGHHMAQASPGPQNVMAMHMNPPVQMLPVAQQYGMRVAPSFHPTAQIAPIVPQYATGVGQMTQGYAPVQNMMMMMHPNAQMMPMIYQPGMGLFPTAQMAPIAQKNSMGVEATPLTAQMVPIAQENGMDARAMPSASATMQDTTDVHSGTGTTFAQQTGARLNPTAPEFVHTATVQEAMPARNSAPGPQADVQSRATVEEPQPIRDAAVEPNERLNWPPVTPPSRFQDFETPDLDRGVVGSRRRRLNMDDLDEYIHVLNEVLSLVPQNATMPIDDYERRLLFLINLMISTQGNADLHNYLLGELRDQEERLTQKLTEVNRESALFELNAARQPQSQSRPDFVALRVYWSLAKGMTVTAFEHLERIGRENMEESSKEMAEDGGGRDTLGEAEDREDFETLENALPRATLPPDPEMTAAHSHFEFAPGSSDDIEATDQSDQNPNHPHSNMKTRQEMLLGVNEAAQRSLPGQEPQPPSADTLSQGLGENGSRDARQVDEAIEIPAMEGNTSPRPCPAGPSSPRSTGIGSGSQAADMDKSPDMEKDANIDMLREAERRFHSRVLVNLLANIWIGEAPVPRAEPSTAVSYVHAFGEFSIDGPDRSHH